MAAEAARHAGRDCAGYERFDDVHDADFRDRLFYNEEIPGSEEVPSIRRARSGAKRGSRDRANGGERSQSGIPVGAAYRVRRRG